MNKKIASIFLATMLAGCAGTRFDFDTARQVKVGMSEREVTDIMGRPYSVVTKGDSEIWIWSQANGFTGSHSSISFTMRNGKVESVPRIPDSFTSSRTQVLDQPSNANSSTPKTQTDIVAREEALSIGNTTNYLTGKKFAMLQAGMSMSEVQETLGRAPDRFHTYESGKRWIPFYFGSDARRMQVLYKNEGCLIFTGGNIWGGGGGELMQIEADPSGVCYQP